MYVCFEGRLLMIVYISHRQPTIDHNFSVLSYPTLELPFACVGMVGCARTGLDRCRDGLVWVGYDGQLCED